MVFTLIVTASLASGGPITMDTDDFPSAGATGSEIGLALGATASIGDLIGPPGEGHWDFNDLITQLSLLSSVEVGGPATSACPDPGTTVVLQRLYTTSELFPPDQWSNFVIDAQGVHMPSTCEPATTLPAVDYDPPVLILPGTMTLGTEWASDSTITIDPYVGTLCATNVVDGWGTVTLPSGDTHPCLRVNRVWIATGDFTLINRYYEWWVPNLGPVVTIGSETIDSGTPPEQFTVAGEVTVRYASTVLYDTDGDYVVGFGDLLDLLAQWGICGGCPADGNDDGVVDFSDLLAMLANWD